ncbi:MAG: PorV/PorQ family protein [Elusimicrobiota bacterium]
MKRALTLIAAAAAALGPLAPRHASAYGKADRGTSGAAFLKLPPGARPSALGEAYSAVADDVYAVYYNPAGLARLGRSELAGMHNKHFQDTSHNFGAVAVPLLSWVDTRRPRYEFGVLALSLTSLSVDGIERRGLVESDEPEGTFGARDFVYTLGYGYAVGDRLSIGAAGKYISQTLDSSRASAFAVDGGTQYRAGRLRAAAGWRNGGSAVKFHSRGNPLPFEVYFAGGYAWSERWLGVVEATLPRDDSPGFAAGVEYRRAIMEDLDGGLRLGYNSEHTAADGLGGVTVGLGLSYGKTAFDFAWVPYGELGSTFRYSVRVRF